jgi:ring-1,2-phenylacetyl-CoA epoxidase subunit PaaD
VRVRAVFDPPWSVDRISEKGRAALQQIGITVPGQDDSASAASDGENCPFCGSHETHLESPYGPTRCRMIYYCSDCKNSFEHMKKLRAGE